MVTVTVTAWRGERGPTDGAPGVSPRVRGVAYSRSKMLFRVSSKAAAPSPSAACRGPLVRPPHVQARGGRVTTGVVRRAAPAGWGAAGRPSARAFVRLLGTKALEHEPEPRDDDASLEALGRSPTMLHGVQLNDEERRAETKTRRAKEKLRAKARTHEEDGESRAFAFTERAKAGAAFRDWHAVGDEEMAAAAAEQAEGERGGAETTSGSGGGSGSGAGTGARAEDAGGVLDLFEDPEAPDPVDVDGFILTEPHNIVLRPPIVKKRSPQQEVKDTFRSMAPYIAAHRGKTVVIHVPGEAIDGQCANFPALVQDIILMHTLGIKIVLVAGCRPQINERLVKAGRDPLSMLDEHGMRRTDAFTLRCVREASSYARVYLESQVGRGLVDTSYTTGLVQVSSGNFVTAKPYTVDSADWVREHYSSCEQREASAAAEEHQYLHDDDFGYAGTVDKINTERINHLLACDDVVLIGCLGYTESGEVYNCASEEVAMHAAAQLGAHKLCFLYDGHELRDRGTGGVVHSMPYTIGRAFLDQYRDHRAAESEYSAEERLEKAKTKEESSVSDLTYQSDSYAMEEDAYSLSLSDEELLMNERKENEVLMYMDLAVEACFLGVRRAHLIQRQEDGSLLLELFTRDGGGLMISRDIYDGVRGARVSDIGALLRLIRPLEEKGVLVRRSKAMLERAIVGGEFTVVERDGTVMACASLSLYDDCGSDGGEGSSYSAEIGCIAVHPAERSSGKGNALVGYLLRRANNLGCREVFALTTRTAHWFIERGFHEAEFDDLPQAKKDIVDRSRNSRVYMMQLSGTRQLDELELLTSVE